MVVLPRSGNVSMEGYYCIDMELPAVRLVDVVVVFRFATTSTSLLRLLKLFGFHVKATNGGAKVTV